MECFIDITIDWINFRTSRIYSIYVILNVIGFASLSNIELAFQYRRIFRDADVKLAE